MNGEHVLSREDGGGPFLVCSDCPDELFLDADDHQVRLAMKGDEL